MPAFTNNHQLSVLIPVSAKRMYQHPCARPVLSDILFWFIFSVQPQTASSGKGKVQVYDAATLAMVAKVALPKSVPLGLHGTFVPASVLSSQ